jgi:transposase
MMNRATWLQERRMTKFADVLKRWERKELSAQESGEILGCSERQFRRWRRRYEEDGDAGLADRRPGRASVRRVPVDRIVWMLGEYRTRHAGWNVKHFHEYVRRKYGFEWGYTWTKLQLQSAGLVGRAKRRGPQPNTAVRLTEWPKKVIRRIGAGFWSKRDGVDLSGMAQSSEIFRGFAHERQGAVRPSHGFSALEHLQTVTHVA